MKELSIEEKAQHYDAAINRANSLLSGNQLGNAWVYKVLPELKESEGEKVKRILHSISNKMGSHLRDIFTDEEFQCFDAWSNAWLEKKGEQGEIDYDEELKRCKANPLYFFDKYVKVKLKEQKPTWSEEDKDYYDAIIAKLEVTQEDAALTDNQMNFLKSLKERYTWKPSDEQIEALVSAIDVMIDNRGAGDKNTILLSGLYHELKTL